MKYKEYSVVAHRYLESDMREVRLRSCSAEVKNLGDIIVLKSYRTVVAWYDVKVV